MTRNRRRLLVSFFASAFTACLIGLLPLQVALPGLGLTDRGLAAREAFGSIWLGGLREASLGRIALGDVQVRLRLAPLFVGRARVDIRSIDRENGIEGGLTVTRRSFGIDDFTGSLNMGGAFGSLPVTSFQLRDVSVHFTGRECTRAEGALTLRTDGDLPGLPLGTSFTGAVRCVGEALVLPLVSQGGGEQVTILLYSDGRYEAQIRIKLPDASGGDDLRAAGYVQAGQTFLLSAAGSL